MDRRAFLLGGGAFGVAPIDRAAGSTDLAEGVVEIEKRAGGRLGVAVIDQRDGRRFGHRADERFPMCSTFKALAAAAVLTRVDAGSLSLERKIAYGAADLLEYAPATKAHVADGAMSPRRSLRGRYAAQRQHRRQSHAADARRPFGGD